MSGVPLVEIRDDRRIVVEAIELGNLRTVRIVPGRRYCVRLYRKRDDPDDRAWTPLDRDGLVVFEVARRAALAGEPAPPKPDLRVLCRIRFQADNDGWFPKMLRWGFRTEESEGLQKTSRIPLLVLPRFSRQATTILGLVLVIVLSNIFEQAVGWCERLVGKMTFLESVACSIGAGVAVFLLLLGATRLLQTLGRARE